jgi:hypothetical protein
MNTAAGVETVMHPKLSAANFVSPAEAGRMGLQEKKRKYFDIFGKQTRSSNAKYITQKIIGDPAQRCSKKLRESCSDAQGDSSSCGSTATYLAAKNAEEMNLPSLKSAFLRTYGTVTKSNNRKWIIQKVTGDPLLLPSKRPRPGL